MSVEHVSSDIFMAYPSMYFNEALWLGLKCSAIPLLHQWVPHYKGKCFQWLPHKTRSTIHSFAYIPHTLPCSLKTKVFSNQRGFLKWMLQHLVRGTVDDCNLSFQCQTIKTETEVEKAKCGVIVDGQKQRSIDCLRNKVSFLYEQTNE